MIKVEYLLPFNTENGICETIDSFKSLISSNSNLKVKTHKITFKGSSYDFNVTLNIVEDKNCSVFHVTFGISRLTEKFREMLKAFRNTIGFHLKENIQVIWDGVSYEWSKELYPEIYQIENKLRKLISKFMLLKLGFGWHKSSVPKDVTESIKKENYKPSHSILYEVDFIQLANFLFKSYSIKDASKLPDILSKIIEDGMTEEKKNEILDYIPKNNWDRYFSNLVEYESGQLKKKWENLYEVRCKVAHNKSMKLEDYEIAKKLCKELDEVLNKALENIENIEIPDEDKESIGLRTIGIVNEPTNYFVSNYLDLSESVSGILRDESEKYAFLGNVENPISAIIDSSATGYLNLSDEIKTGLHSINNYKDDLLSGTSIFHSFGTDVNDNTFLTTKNDILSALKSDDIISGKTFNLNSDLIVPPELESDTDTESNDKDEE